MCDATIYKQLTDIKHSSITAWYRSKICCSKTPFQPCYFISQISVLDFPALPYSPSFYSLAFSVTPIKILLHTLYLPRLSILKRMPSQFKKTNTLGTLSMHIS